ncbi:MAG TPA: hypothetical protein VFI61_04580 [Patescibacteria group bacterium]|nr:hypothetical protein [Patescibacteria group bacterium]
MTTEAAKVVTDGRDPLIAGDCVEVVMKNGDKTKKTVVVLAPIKTKNEGFDPQAPAGPDLSTIDPVA